MRKNGVKLNCVVCKGEVEVQYYRRNIAKYCSYKCYWLDKKSKSSWNKDLNKYVDERVARYGRFISNTKKGKTYEELYGVEKAKLMRRNLSEKFKGRKIWWQSKVLAKVCQRPNNFERKCGEYLKEMFSNKFVYCGNGSMEINGRFPDFISKELNVVVLCNGLYWHLFRFGLEDTLANRQQMELKESQPFIKAGWEVWFIWETLDRKIEESLVWSY